MFQYFCPLAVAMWLVVAPPNAPCAEPTPPSRAAQVYLESARAKAWRHDFQGVVADLSRAIEIDPTKADLCNGRGWLLQWVDPARAIADFTKAIELDPRHVRAYYNRGVRYAAAGLFDKALADLNQAIALATGNDPATVNDQLRGEMYEKRARVYTDTGRTRDAVADGWMAIRLAPANVDARLTLAQALAQQGQVAAALQQQNIAARLAPGNPVVYADRAVTFYNTGRYKLARHELRLYLQAGGPPDTAFAQRLRDALDNQDRLRAANKSLPPQPIAADGIFSDQTTGLMWQVDSAPELTWSEAEAYCRGLALGGFHDWRLPSAEELAGLYKSLRLDVSHSRADADATPLLWRTNLYWSSSVNLFGNAARGLLFFAGPPASEPTVGMAPWWAKDAQLGVRAVRTITPAELARDSVDAPPNAQRADAARGAAPPAGQPPDKAQAAAINIGDTILVLHRIAIRRGETVVGQVPEGTPLPVTGLDGDFVGVTVAVNGEQQTAWVPKQRVTKPDGSFRITAATGQSAAAHAQRGLAGRAPGPAERPPAIEPQSQLQLKLAGANPVSAEQGRGRVQDPTGQTTVLGAGTTNFVAGAMLPREPATGP